jgi:hypothetical protein
MSLTSAYLVTPKNLQAFLDAVRAAQAPERLTNKFLTDLEFASSNDRLFIGLFKALGLINDTGEPTDRYFQFLDNSESGRVLATGIREAYDDLFKVNREAYRLDEAEVRNKLKTLTRGEKSENVINLMAKTFVSLCALADWSRQEATMEPTPTEKRQEEKMVVVSHKPETRGAVGLHYNIQIHLPPTRDSAVYDAIFKSLREHLMT